MLVFESALFLSRMTPVEDSAANIAALPSSSLFVTIEKEDAGAFEKFCELRISHSTNFLLGLVFVCTSSYMYIMSLMNDEAGPFLTSAVVPGLWLNLVLMSMIYFQYQMRFGELSICAARVVPFVPIIMNALAVCESLAMGLYLIARIYNGACDELDQYHRWSCNSEYEVGALPQGTLLIYMFLPLLFSVALKTVKTSIVLLSWGIVVISVAISIGVADSVYSIPVLVFYIPLSLVFIWEIHRQNVYQFLLLKRQQVLLDTNRRLADETQTELRFMIANMAHDLKTVSLC